ncbi:MAG: class I SAM-dependent methyltransferase [Deltaproteobacteria bacterium]
MVKTVDRFEQIKAHFEKEAAVFDRLFFKVMPEYRAMSEALAEALPFPKAARPSVIDLGCGTGNLAEKVLARYTKARLTCVDMAENMLIMARAKLKGRSIEFRQADILKFPYKTCDAVVSSLVLHHVEERQKPRFYRKLYSALRSGGAFYNIDIFVSPDPRLQKLFMEKWKAFMAAGLPRRRVNEMIARHQREDRPTDLASELGFMREAGFKRIEVVLKRYNFAVYGGIKQ